MDIFGNFRKFSENFRGRSFGLRNNFGNLRKCSDNHQKEHYTLAFMFSWQEHNIHNCLLATVYYPLYPTIYSYIFEPCSLEIPPSSRTPSINLEPNRQFGIDDTNPCPSINLESNRQFGIDDTNLC